MGRDKCYIETTYHTKGYKWVYEDVGELYESGKLLIGGRFA
ncbi:MAG: hypothetical protein ACR2J3_02170 [Aridibacter sp.]